MADTLTDKMKTELKELKKAHRTKEREKTKRIRAQMEVIRMDEDIEAWKVITQVKIGIAQQLTGNKLTKGYNIKHIAAIPDYYEYQHPTEAKKKSNSKDADWIKAFLDGGGTEKQMIDAAALSRVKVWRRIAWKRSKKETTATTTAPMAPQQKNKVGSGGVG